MLTLSDEAKKKYARYVGSDGKLIIDEALPEDVKEAFEFFNENDINILELNISDENIFEDDESEEEVTEDFDVEDNFNEISDEDFDFSDDLDDSINISETDTNVDLSDLESLF